MLKNPFNKKKARKIFMIKNVKSTSLTIEKIYLPKNQNKNSLKNCGVQRNSSAENNIE